MTAVATFGRTYGYVVQNGEEKSFGSLLWMCSRLPPRKGPIAKAIVNVNGNNENACARFEASELSYILGKLRH
jgi:predicted metal-binding transcription factor (methanogenesis marker protein 9)